MLFRLNIIMIRSLKNDQNTRYLCAYTHKDALKTKIVPLVAKKVVILNLSK